MSFSAEQLQPRLKPLLNQIFNEDCLEGMQRIPDGAIDLTVTSPPYDNLRNYALGIATQWAQPVWEQVIRELYRVTRQGGVVVWVVGDATIKGSETGSSFKQALFFKEVGFSLHDTMIYQKETPIPQFKSHRYTNSFEYMFVFSRGKPTKGTLLEVKTKCGGRVDKNYRGQVTSDDKYIGKDVKVIKDSKLRANIWTYSQNNGIDRNIGHTAQFPEQLARDHILSWSNQGDVVLDPFMGAGTTAKMAVLEKRHFIGFELNAEYRRLALKRVAAISITPAIPPARALA